MQEIDLHIWYRYTGFLKQTNGIKKEIDYNRIVVLPVLVNPKAIANDNEVDDASIS